MSYRFKGINGLEINPIYQYDYYGLNKDFYSFIYSCEKISVCKVEMDYIPLLDYNSSVKSDVCKEKDDFFEISVSNNILNVSFYIMYKGLNLCITLRPCFNDLNLFFITESVDKEKQDYIRGSFMTDLHTYLSLHS